MTVSYYLTRPDSKTETSIFARICYNGYQLKYYTPERIFPKYWSKESKRAKQTDKFKEYPEFNKRLENFATDVKNIFRTWVNDNTGSIPKPDTFKELLDGKLKQDCNKINLHSFFPFFENFIIRSKSGSRINYKSKQATVYNTNKGYISTLNHLKNFQKQYNRKIDFAKIDLEFYADYINYLTKKARLSSNTIGDHIKRIKTVMNEATEKGINKNLAFRSKYFAKPGEQAQSIFLSADELKEIECLDLSKNSKLERVRDLFLVGCYTGLRYSDYSILKPEQIKDGFIETKQIKTGEPVVIPIHPIVEEILLKYNGQLPKSISNQKTNEYLKELGEKLECLKSSTSKTMTKGGVKLTQSYSKWELLSTHTARRSFATNEYLAGTPAITIMAVTGHKTEKAFLRYIKLTPNEHAKLLKLHWQKRHGLRAV